MLWQEQGTPRLVMDAPLSRPKGQTQAPFRQFLSDLYKLGALDSSAPDIWRPHLSRNWGPATGSQTRTPLEPELDQA